MTGTRWLISLFAVALACSSSSKDGAEEHESNETNDEPAAAEPADGDTAEADCRGGSAEACVRAGDQKADGDPELAKELYGLACFHGAAEGCARRADESTTPALWYGKACRRGDDAACAKADPWARRVAERLTVAEGAEPIRAVYRHTVADCIAQASRKTREAAAEIAIDRQGDTPSVRAPAPLKPCIEKAAARWPASIAGTARFDLAAP